MVKVLSIVGVLSLVLVITATVFIAGQPTSSTPKASDQNRISKPGYVADSAFVDEETPKKNFGDSAVLWADGVPKRIAYIKLNLSSLSGGNVTRADLRLFVTNESTGVSQVKFVPISTWSGNTITYSARPLPTETVTEFSKGKTGEWLSVDLTDFVNKHKGEIVSVAISSSSPEGFGFNSIRSPFGKLELLVQ